MCAALLVSFRLTIANQISSDLIRSRAIGIVLIGVSSWSSSRLPVFL